MISVLDEVEDQATDGFDLLPDSLIFVIFNSISDIKTLIRCRAVSKRFYSLVPQVDTLLLRVDRVISSTEPDGYDDNDDDSVLVSFLRSIFRSIHDLISPKSLSGSPRSQNSPTQILRGFQRIREVEIELPSGDLRLDKGAVIRWKAVFGKTLKSCVILGFRGIGNGDAGVPAPAPGAGAGGLKMRVVWTISALIAASARHYMLKEMVTEHGELERLVVRDRDGEGTVLMDKEGLIEYRDIGNGGVRDEDEGEEDEEDGEEDPQIEDRGGDGRGGGGVWWKNNRTTVPAVRMRMRHEAQLELSGGVRMEGATLVIVRPTITSNCGGAAEMESEEEEQSGGAAELAIGAFEGVYKEAVERLLKSRSYLLEMNSF